MGVNVLGGINLESRPFCRVGALGKGPSINCMRMRSIQVIDVTRYSLVHVRCMKMSYTLCHHSSSELLFFTPFIACMCDNRTCVQLWFIVTFNNYIIQCIQFYTIIQS